MVLMRTGRVLMVVLELYMSLGLCAHLELFNLTP